MIEPDLTGLWQLHFGKYFIEPVAITHRLLEFSGVMQNARLRVSQRGDWDPRYGMHSLRHACASLWIESGYNPKQI